MKYSTELEWVSMLSVFTDNYSQLTFTCSASTTSGKKCEICSKLTKTKERRQLRRSGVFIVNFEHMSQLFLLSLLLTFSKSSLSKRHRVSFSGTSIFCKSFIKDF